MPPDMFVEPERDPRPEPPTRGDEPATLLGFRRWPRATLELECSGLGPAELARRSAEPSTMSLRWVLVLIGEYARHNGHAVLLRERIDGAVGH